MDMAVIKAQIVASLRSVATTIEGTPDEHMPLAFAYDYEVSRRQLLAAIRLVDAIHTEQGFLTKYTTP